MKEFVEKLIGRLEEQKVNVNGYLSCEGKKLAKYRNNCVDTCKEIVNQLAKEYQSRIMIDGQYCWQTCACTEKCNECNRLTLASSDIDWYENIEDWTEEYRPRTNADFIRKMNDEELADYIFGVSVGNAPCVLCSDECDFCELTDEECKTKTLAWLQSEVKGSDV